MNSVDMLLNQHRLNPIEVRAVELIKANKKSEAMYMLEDQLERDPSRAEIAAILANSIHHFVQGASFSRIKKCYDAGFEDPYSMCMSKSHIANKRKFWAEKVKEIKPPSYAKAMMDASRSTDSDKKTK